MNNYGDIDPGDIIDHKITTYDVTTRAPAASTGSPALRVYKDNSGTGSTAGITFTREFQAVTGLNHLRIDTSADAAFYSTGSNFQAVFTAGNVGSVSLNGSAALYFSIGKRSALRPDTAGRKIQVNPNGYAGLDWGNIANKTASAQLSSTLIDAVNYAVIDWAAIINKTASANFSNTIIATVSSIVGLTPAQVFNASVGSGSENGQTYGQQIRGIYAAVAGRSRRSTASIEFYGHDSTTSRLVMQFNGNSDRSSVTATLG